MPEISDDIFHQLLKQLVEDPAREGLQETPARAAKAWAEWVSGYSLDPRDVLKVFEDGADNYDELVFQGGIPVYSHCEHHLAPIFGVAHVGYIPDGKIVGLSKLSRLVNVFARRLQVQERMTVQVAQALSDLVSPKAVGVVMQCRHMCMESRGIKTAGTTTHTSALIGAFRSEPSARAEFMALVNAQRSVGVL